MASKLFRTKPLGRLLEDTEGDGHRLRRALGPFDLVALGIGCIIGVGIFVLPGVEAANHAGPGIILSFAIAASACACAALCYAELAAMIPVAGSAYTYGYATLGELLAWIIGWDLDPRVHGRRQPGLDRLVGVPREPDRSASSSRSAMVLAAHLDGGAVGAEPWHRQPPRRVHRRRPHPVCSSAASARAHGSTWSW